jgi:hypothetical protein
MLMGVVWAGLIERVGEDWRFIAMWFQLIQREKLMGKYFWN